MKKKSMIFYRSILLVISFLLFTFSGCRIDKIITYTPVNNTSGEIYSTFSATEIPPFSFEYPNNYVITSYQSMPRFPSTSVLLRTIESLPVTTITDEAPKDFIFNGIDVYIAYFNEYVPTAETAIDNIAVKYEQYEEAGHVKDFKIIYKRQVVVGGFKGWEIKYSFIKYEITLIGIDYSHPTPLVVRQVYFDYQDMSFNLILTSDASIIDKTEKGYEHILQTFKLLE